MLACRQLNLKNKSPLFHSFTETIGGLTQIKTYNRTESQIYRFSKIVNNCTKATISFDVTSAAFGFYQVITFVGLMASGLFLGVYKSSTEEGMLFGVTVVSLIAICDIFQWLMRQLITIDSLMISSQRVI